MAIQASNVQDLINSTLSKYGRMKFTDIMSRYNKTIAFKRLMKKGKMTFDGGTKVIWNLLTSTNGSARYVGLGVTDVVDIPNVTTQGEIEWKHATFNWAIVHQMISMNSGSAERIFNLIQSQRIAAFGDWVILAEQRFWRTPTSTDQVNPNGVQYWIVKNNTTGFNGATPAGFTVVGNINPSTYTRWKNYTAQYTNVTDSDVVDKMRTCAWEIDFEPLVDETPVYSAGDDLVLYMNFATLKNLETIARSNNDQLGFDLDPTSGKTMFRRRVMSPVKELEDDTVNPIYFINWSDFGCIGLEKEWMRNTVIPVKSDQHNVSVTHTDITHNYIMRDRRKHAVLATDTTVMA